MNRFSFVDFIEKLKPNINESHGREPKPGLIPIELLPEELQSKEKIEWIYVDLREKKRTKSRGEAKGKRSWKDCQGITLHQTAVDFGIDPMKMLNVPVHGGTLQNGTIILLHDPTDYMWHAHHLNKYDIGIEVSCRAAGIEGDLRTFWLSKKEKKKVVKPEQLLKEASDIQLEATKELCRYYINIVKENGGEIKYIHAHRQGRDDRISDPGSRIWQKVGIPIMKEFNLSCGPIGWKIGSGTPIPEVWDSINGKGIDYSWKIKGR